jgi:NCAIR mutase (PurE)-related protein
MDPARLRRILADVRRGRLTTGKALEALAGLPFETAGPALVDHHRTLRQHLPEVIFCQGKTVPQCVTIAKAVVKRSGRCLATRVSPAQAASLVEAFEGRATWNEAARAVAIGRRARTARRGGRGVPGKTGGSVLIVTAGTSDVPVAEEAAVTLEFMGVPASRVYDAGVAGIHRLLAHLRALRTASAIVVVAGMEGALASVVGGITHRPVIAVPTSVGYGASYGGLAALLAMLNSCAAGVTVVNIDNGFGAGYAAGVIARQSRARRKS